MVSIDRLLAESFKDVPPSVDEMNDALPRATQLERRPISDGVERSNVEMVGWCIVLLWSAATGACFSGSYSMAAMKGIYSRAASWWTCGASWHDVRPIR